MPHAISGLAWLSAVDGASAWNCARAPSARRGQDSATRADLSAAGSAAELAARVGELARDRFGNARTELVVEVAEVGDPAEPLAAIRPQRLIEPRPREAEAVGVERVGRGNPPDRRFLCAPAAAHALDDPLEHADVVTVARPQELAVGVSAEPIHAEDP